MRQVHRCGGQEEIQEDLSTVDHVEVDAEGPDGVAGHGVVDGPVEEGDDEGEGTHNDLKEPLQAE